MAKVSKPTVIPRRRVHGLEVTKPALKHIHLSTGVQSLCAPFLLHLPFIPPLLLNSVLTRSLMSLRSPSKVVNLPPTAAIPNSNSSSGMRMLHVSDCTNNHNMTKLAWLSQLQHDSGIGLLSCEKVPSSSLYALFEDHNGNKSFDFIMFISSTVFGVCQGSPIWAEGVQIKITQVFLLLQIRLEKHQQISAK